jgi:hypothetical protein
MRKTSLFAIAATLIVAGVGVWSASTTTARVAPSMGSGIEPMQIMMKANNLPRTEFADYTFVFR